MAGARRIWLAALDDDYGSSMNIMAGRARRIWLFADEYYGWPRSSNIDDAGADMACWRPRDVTGARRI
jgi:hypothetical protein